MNVLILMPMSEQRGGAEMTLYHLMQNRYRFPIEWHIVFFQEGSFIDEFKKLGVNTSVVSTGRLRELQRFILSVREISKIARDFQADLILSWTSKAHLYGSFVSLLTRIPSTWYQQGYPVGNHLFTLDKIATLLPANAIITVSQAVMARQKSVWPVRPTFLVYPGVDLEKFDSSKLPVQNEARRLLGLPESGPLIGIVGRLQYWKGVHTLIRAMTTISQVSPDAHCVIVGGQHELEPEYESKLFDLIEELGLGEKVIMAGFQRNIPLWIQAMDVFVHASDNEPFGLVVIEAMSLGKPVVAGNEGGPKEMITEGVNGLLAPFDDSLALAKQIIRYLEQPEFTRNVAQAAKERAKDFSVDHYAARFVEVISDILS